MLFADNGNSIKLKSVSDICIATLLKFMFFPVLCIKFYIPDQRYRVVLILVIRYYKDLLSHVSE